jgi:cytochrome c oxidase subunit 1
MLFSLGFIVMFTIGGVSGVLHSVVPGDTQQTDTYFVVAHFHYVLFGGLILAIFSGFYFWFPKFFGRMLNERMGKINFWTMLIGFNLTFFPMHLLGLYGQPRRTYRYDTGMGWTGLNQIVSIGSFLVAFSVLIFLVNVIFSLVAKRGAVAGNDPWDARTLEWSVSSPPPAYNFAEIPQVSGPDGFWDQKYTEDDQGRLLAIPSGGSASAKPESDGSGIHLPSPSIYPLVVAIGIMPIAYGAVFENLIMVGAGVLVMLFGMYAWAIEPSTEEH